MKPKVVATLFIVSTLLTTLITVFGARSVFAHDPTHIWRLPDKMVMLDLTTNYSSAVTHARYQYDSHAKLVVWIGPQQQFFMGNYSNIVFIEGDYGASGWMGHTLTYNNMKPCYTELANGTQEANGNCNTETLTADFAKIKLNKFADYLPAAETKWGVNWRKRLTTHETGHALGYPHFACFGPGAIDSIMGEHPIEGRTCSSYPYALTSHDIADINRDY